MFSLIPSSFWEDGARGTEWMLAHKGIVLRCRDAAGPALWLGAEAKMRGSRIVSQGITMENWPSAV